MKNLLSAKEAPINKILCADYTLVIPEYQRPYAWTTDEAETLLDDLLGHLERSGGTFSNDITPYFLGSVVLAKQSGDPLAEVVDGQQRLSTLTILLACLRARLQGPQPRTADEIGSLVFEPGSRIKNIDSHYRLTMRKRDREFFQKSIQSPEGLAELVSNEGRIPEEPQHLIRENAKLFKNRLAQMDDRLVEDLATLISAKCYLVVVETEDFSSAYRVFNVLNDRGRDLSDTDILKAELLGSIPEESRGEHADHWDDIEAKLGRKELGNLLGHIKAIETKITKQGGLVEEFRERVMGRKGRPFEAAHFIRNELQPMASIYRDLLDANYGTRNMEHRTHEDETNDALYWLNSVHAEDWVPLALLAWTHLKQDPALMSQFFRGLERLAYSMLIRNLSGARRVIRFADIIRTIESEPGNTDLIFSALDLTAREQNQTLASLDGPVYETIGQRKLRSLLQRLSHLLSSDKMVSKPGTGAKAVSIEHILPQNPEEGGEWTQWIPSPADRDLWTNRIGNLTLLNQGKNSGAGRKDFNAKKLRYFKEGGTTPFAITAQIDAEGVWGVEQMEERQELLIETLAEHWDLKQTAPGTEPQIGTGIRRRKRFRFDEAGIGVGSTIHWGADPTLTVVVSGGNQVSLKGQEMSLLAATKSILGAAWVNRSIRPISFWSYQGKSLEDIYNEYIDGI